MRDNGYILHTLQMQPSIVVKHSWAHMILGTEARALCLCTSHLPPSRLVTHHADWHSAVKGQPLCTYDQVLVFRTLQFSDSSVWI